MPSESITDLLWAIGNVSPPTRKASLPSSDMPSAFKSQSQSQAAQTNAGIEERRRQSWDFAEAHPPTYQATSTTSTAPIAMGPAMPAVPHAPPAPPKQRRPSWVERHLALNEEDTRRALGM